MHVPNFVTFSEVYPYSSEFESFNIDMFMFLWKHILGERLGKIRP